MTPQELDGALAPFPQDAPLIFRSPDGPIGAGYHVTEWKLARIESIDCGAQRSAWTEAVLQLLDGAGHEHMDIAKFRGILRKSIQAMPELGQTAFRIEYSPNNVGLRIFEPQVPVGNQSSVVVGLHDSGAQCKPMQMIDPTCCAQPAQSACCG